MRFNNIRILIFALFLFMTQAIAQNFCSGLNKDMILRDYLYLQLKNDFEKRKKYRINLNEQEFEQYALDVRSRFAQLVFDDTQWQLFRKKPVNYQINETSRDCGDYVIKKLKYESMPDRWATANLYLPKNAHFPVPGIVAVADHAIGGKAAPYNQQQGIVFSKKGFVTLVIDAPDRGEQVGGNDHFVNGPQLALTGLWSNYFFIADALRAVDCLRSLAEYVEPGKIGMTGTSGGGETSAVAAALDPSIQAVVPCCYIEPFFRCVDIAYTYCPEYFIPADKKGSLDWADIMAATVPRPLAPVRAMQDSLFTNEGFNEIVNLGQYFYKLNDIPERFKVIRTNEPHTYSAVMRELAYKWFSKWLGSCGKENLPEITDRIYEPNEVFYTPKNSQLTLMSENDLEVGVKSKVNMHILALNRAERFKKNKYSFNSQDFNTKHAENIRERVKRFYSVEKSIQDFQVKRHKTKESNIETENLFFYHNGNLNFEAKVIAPDSQPVKRLVIYIDEDGFQNLDKNDLKAITKDGTAVFAVQLRGMGDYYPRASHWDKYAWCDISRPVSYAAWTLGTSIPHLQVEDTLIAIEWIKTQNRFSSKPMFIAGMGQAAPIALMSAVIDDDICGILGDRSLVSYADYVEKPLPGFNQMALSYGVLKEFDIPVVLASAINRLVLWSNPVDADNKLINDVEIRKNYELACGLLKDPQAVFTSDTNLTLTKLIEICIQSKYN